MSLSLTSKVKWKPTIRYPSMYLEILISEPNQFEVLQKNIWKESLSTIPGRIKDHYNIDNVSIIHDHNHNLVWFISKIPIPEEGDIKRDKNSMEIENECNIRSLVRFISKLYKPIVWDNIGIGFITYDEYNNYIKNSITGKRSSQKEIEKQSLLVENEEEYIETFKKAISNIRAGQKKDTSSPKGVSNNVLTKAIFKSLPKPPACFFKPGRNKAEDQEILDRWEKFIVDSGYSVEDYKQFYREYRRVYKSNPYD